MQPPRFRALLKICPVENLFPLLDHNALASKSILCKHCIGGGHFLVVDCDAALLNQTPSLAVGGAQAAGHQQRQNANFTVCELSGVQSRGRHIRR